MTPKRVITPSLTHRAMVQLLERNVIEVGLFDEKTIHEVIDPEQPHKRYCLCRNPQTAQREGATRERLLALTEQGLNQIRQYKVNSRQAGLTR